MIRWMRAWNSSPNRSRELRFYCMDGTGNWSHAQHAYTAVHDYARCVDQSLAQDVRRDFEQAVQDVTFETRKNVEESTWRHLRTAVTN